jgi:NADH-quinone oxidoreductase subunit J
MTFEQVSFFVLAAVALASGLGVILFRNAVYSMLSLILNLLSLAFFFLMLNGMFIATIQVLIYAGAVMVLFLFVVTMLTSDDARVGGPDRLRWQWGAGFLLAVIFAGALSLALLQGTVARDACTLDPQGCLAAQVAQNGNTETFGLALFHAYSFPFEVTSVLLVIAVLGAVVLGQRALRAGREAPVEQNGAAEREPEEASNAR